MAVPSLALPTHSKYNEDFANLVEPSNIATFCAELSTLHVFFRSRLKTRTQLFDVAAAGPLAGGVVALVIFINGLALSATGDAAELVKVPSSLLQVQCRMPM